MVALYWLLNRLFTYWFMSEVLPTLCKDMESGDQGHRETDEPAVAENYDLGTCEGQEWYIERRRYLEQYAAHVVEGER